MYRCGGIIVHCKRWGVIIYCKTINSSKKQSLSIFLRSSKFLFLRLRITANILRFVSYKLDHYTKAGATV